MKSKKQIKKVLDDMGIIYRSEEMTMDNVQIDTYLIHLVSDNIIFFGGILYCGANDITIMFFYHILKNLDNEYDILKRINEMNKSCKYGNFTYDGQDVMYNLAITLIKDNSISESVFRFYFENVISTIKGVSGELLNEY